MNPTKNIPTIIQQIVVPLLGAALPAIAAGNIPHDARGWCVLFAGAAIASGLLNTTAPRNQASVTLKKDATP